MVTVSLNVLYGSNAVVCLLFIVNRYLVLDIADDPLQNILKFFQPVSVTVCFDEAFIELLQFSRSFVTALVYTAHKLQN